MIFSKRRNFLVLSLDLTLVSTINLAFLGFTINGIYAGLTILPIYDFASLFEYDLIIELIFLASVLLAVGISKSNLALVFSGIAVQAFLVLTELANRSAFVPQFVALQEDPSVYNKVYGNLPQAFFSAPWYELVNSLVFICFVVGSVLLLLRLNLRFGFAKSLAVTLLVSSGLLLYFEYVAINFNISGGGVSWIEGEKITNFSIAWPLIGQLTNFEFALICSAVFAGTALISGTLLLFRKRAIRE